MKGFSFQDPAFLKSVKGSTLDPLVASWVARCNSHGGNPSPGVQSAVNTFWKAVKAAGLDTRIFLLNVFAGLDSATVRTPLVAGGGYDIWTEYGTSVVDDTIANEGNIGNGVEGNGSGHWETGFVMSTKGSQTNYGASIYFYDYGSDEFAGVCNGSAADGNMWKFISDSGTFTANGWPNGSGLADANTNGFHGWTIESAGTGLARVRNYFGNSSSPLFESGNTTFPLGSADRPTVQDCWVFKVNTIDDSSQPCTGIISFFALHERFSTADYQTFGALVQQLRVNMGGGWV